jgi:hypothetical protein
MEAIQNVLSYIINNAGTVVTQVLAILGAFSVLAKLTPTKKDDAVIDFILRIIHTLGLTKKA